VISQIQGVWAVPVILTALLVSISPAADLRCTVLQAQQAAFMVVLAITFAVQRILLRRSSDPVLQGIFDASSSRVPLSGSSTLACALLG
jgi:hypothetical protein